MNFQHLKEPVTRQFNELSKHQLFCTAVEKEDLWEHYLKSFPLGSDPIFRKRTEHDCSCCRQFIKTVGAVVAVIDGNLTTIWDTEFKDPAYQTVADAMAKLVKSRAIAKPFLHYERQIGIDKNYEEDHNKGDGADEPKITIWEHFHVQLFNRNTGPELYCDKAEIAPKIGEAQARHDVLLRSLTELTPDAIDTTLDLIAQGTLYRGNEYKHLVVGLKKLRLDFDLLVPTEQDTFAWVKAMTLPENQCKIRNTAIGTLLIDLSIGMDLEKAVTRFEKVVAPENYKRTTSLVTKAMVDKARATIAELGLGSALERRYARLTDVNVGDVIFADRKARDVMSGDDVFASVPTKASTPKNLDKVESVSIEQFIEQIVPRAESIEIMFENQHIPKLVSLIAPKHADAKPLFKWSNGFSWSYNGEVTDSIKERVKRAGGNVNADLCCRLAWYNFDDLDLHMAEPNGGTHIHFGNKGPSPFGGKLDVDMNAGSGKTQEPVENIFYNNKSRMRTGLYRLFVHQYAKREADNPGFEIEIDCLGQLTQLVYEKPVRQGEQVQVASIRCKASGELEIIPVLPSTQSSKIAWGLKTREFHRVAAMMYSPNYWTNHQGIGLDGIGNKHVFFMLDKCANDGSARGFYNEFLRKELDPHRKVIELVGSKSKVEASDNQLSGLGFSSTQKTELLARVKGSFTRTIKVVF